MKELLLYKQLSIQSQLAHKCVILITGGNIIIKTPCAITETEFQSLNPSL